MQKRTFPIVLLFCLALMGHAFAYSETKDLNKDGKVDAWIEYDNAGEPVKASFDRHVDGKPDAWRYYRNGIVYLREWDRNFDGKADFKITESFGRFVEKSYDDNFDGKFEKTVRAPKKGSSGRIKTSADYPNQAP